MSALGSWSLISAGYLRVSAHFPFSFVSAVCETEACCQPWSGEAGDLLQYEPQHIWGFKVSSHPSPTIQALSRLNTPSPSVAPLCRSEICSHSSQSWRVKERIREKPCAEWRDFSFILEPLQVKHPWERTRGTGIDFNVKVMSSEKCHVYTHHFITRW